MADNIDSVIASGGPDGLQKLGSIMSLGLQHQQLQNAQLANQQGQVTLQNAQATQQADQARSIAESESSQQQSQQQQLKTLQAHVANGIGQLLMLHNKNATSDQIGSIITSTMKNAGAHDDAIAQALSSIPTQAALDANPQLADQFIIQKAASGIGGMEQLNKVAPNMTPLSTGGQIEMANTGNPEATGKVQQPLANTLSPNERSSVAFNSNGQPITVTKPDNGLNPTISGTPVGGQVTQPFVMPEGENEGSLKYATDLRTSASTAAASVPANATFANNVIKYAKGATTGTGADTMNNLMGQFAGVPWTSDRATNYNLMGHAISQETAGLIKASGLSTNQGQSLVANQIGEKGWTNESIQTAMREVRALNTGVGLINQGIGNTTYYITKNKGTSKGQFGSTQFQNDYSKVLDVNALKLYDAVKYQNQDPEGLTNIVKQLGGPTPKNPKGSIIYQQTLQNIDKMQQLLKGGQ